MPRSNRRLTQFAIEKIQQFFRSPEAFQDEVKGNTSVELLAREVDGSLCENLVVSLFGEEIFSAALNRSRGVEISRVVLSGGNFYDGQGRPSRTTRERLNGLLDYMSTLCVLPEGVRVFIEKDAEECYVGKGMSRVRLDKANPCISLQASPSTLLVS